MVERTSKPKFLIGEPIQNRDVFIALPDGQELEASSIHRTVGNKREYPSPVGFGIKTKENAKEVAKIADGVVVGSSIVDIIQTSLNDQKSGDDMKNKVLKYVKELSEGVKQGRK